MPTPEKHALLSASSSHRWLMCTAAPRFEADFPAETSEYAQEGRLAHAICELYVRRELMKLHGRTFKAQLAKLAESPLYNPEMLATANEYVQYLKEKYLAFQNPPHLNVEVQVDLSDWIPEGFGTCDCVMMGGDTLHITDYKHGKGVEVSAVNNPQMRLYALGALKMYRLIYGDTIKYVSTGIFQPRITSLASEEKVTVENLLAWGESIKPIAQKAFDGKGDFVPGEHCRFCRAKRVCRARSMQNMAVEEFKDCVTPDKAQEPLDPQARQVLGMSPILTDSEVGDLLTRGKFLMDWYDDLKDYALKALLEGKCIPGYKAVAGRSNRAFHDTDVALEILQKAGLDKAVIYDYKPKSLSELEKVIGKKRFAELLQDQIYKPMGKPTLAEESDAREPFNSAVTDFAGEAQNV